MEVTGQNNISMSNFSRLQTIIAATFVVAAALAVAQIAEPLGESLEIEFRNWLSELTAPRLSYPQFRQLIDNRTIALSNIEQIDWVKTNYAGDFFLVKLKNRPEFFRVYLPDSAGEAPFRKIDSYGIEINNYYSCL